MAEQLAELNKSSGGYSNQETIVGTWADTGKTAYKRTFTGTISSTSGSAKLIDNNLIYIKKVISCETELNGLWLVIPYFNQTMTSGISLYHNDHEVWVQSTNDSWINGKQYKIDLIYTKS